MTPIDDTEDEIGYPKTDSGSNGLHPCEPPIRDVHTIDIDKRRNELEGERYEQSRDSESLSIHADPPGTGKTTSLPRGADRHDDALVLYLPTHQNCHEFMTADSDDPKPEPDHHLKGPTQPVHNECMTARGTDDECEKHGSATCETMCPVYTEASEQFQERFETVRDRLGTGEAHRILNVVERDWHSKNCKWQEQWDKVDKSDFVVTVPNYITSNKLNQDRLNIIDDVQSLLTEKKTLTSSDLNNVKHNLEQMETCMSSAVSEVSSFIEALSKTLVSDDAGVSDLSPPEIDIPKGWMEDRLPKDGDLLAETLIWIQHAYREKVLQNTECDKNVTVGVGNSASGEMPFHLDAVFAAAAGAGLPSDSVRRAISARPGIEHCPKCGETRGYGRDTTEKKWIGATRTDVQTKMAYHICDNCGWSKENDPLTPEVTELQRARSWTRRTTRRTTSQYELVFGSLPLIGDLPDPSETMILDATPVPEVYALLFGLDRGGVRVLGNDPVALNATVTQITNGQYHRGTIVNAKEEGKSLVNNIQDTIDQIADVHERAILVGHKRVQGFYEIPENAEWLSFHASRGLDRSDFDAVVVIGAPHTPPKELHEEATLLAMDRENVRVGGEEHTSRNGDETCPPIHRKYYYENNKGKGRAIETKHFTGLVGKLFRSRREDEIVQLAHRNRPVTANDRKHIYLLTNVPTELPVDNLVEFSRLIDPLADQITEVTSTGCSFSRAVELLQNACDVMKNGRCKARNTYFEEWTEDSFTITGEGAHSLFTDINNNMDVKKSTVKRYLRMLWTAGLGEKNYEEQAGYQYCFDLATSQRAVLVLSNNAICEVDALRQLADWIKNDERDDEWIQWAEDRFDLGEDSSS